MSIDIANESGWDADEEAILDVARFALDKMRIHPQSELSVILVDGAAMEELHIQWMDLPGPTDVMSFPMDELRPGKEGEELPQGLLGDIVLCPEVAEQQGKAAPSKHSMDEEPNCSPSTGCCTSSGTTTRSPRRRRRCSPSRSASWTTGGRAGASVVSPRPPPPTERGARTPVSGESTSFILGAVLLVVLGWLAACAEAGISRVSRFRAEEAVRAGRRGSARLLTVASDPIRYLNLATLIRVASEMAAAVLVTVVCVRNVEPIWQAVLLAFGVMVLVSFVAVGVSPRTIGRQHPLTTATAASFVLLPLAAVLGPIRGC